MHQFSCVIVSQSTPLFELWMTENNLESEKVQSLAVKMRSLCDSTKLVFGIKSQGSLPGIEFKDFIIGFRRSTFLYVPY